MESLTITAYPVSAAENEYALFAGTMSASPPSSPTVMMIRCIVLLSVVSTPESISPLVQRIADENWNATLLVSV
ncbi:MAG: hypothetical protein J6U16_00990 [Ruminococcus sp.]|nr:hypothetical protein [Ruminococcus sp.]